MAIIFIIIIIIIIIITGIHSAYCKIEYRGFPGSMTERRASHPTSF